MSINTEKATMVATKALIELDEKFIGTPDYFGKAYFWHWDYKFPMRDLTPYQRVLVHKALLKSGLNVSDNSEKHTEIMKRFTKRFQKTLERKIGKFIEG